MLLMVILGGTTVSSLALFCCLRSRTKSATGADGDRRGDPLADKTSSESLLPEVASNNNDETHRNNRRPSTAPAPQPMTPGQFRSALARLKADSSLQLDDEFLTLRRVSPARSVRVAHQHRNKNRFANVLPYDHSRVPLPDGGYINANFVPGLEDPKEYIACQAPLAETVADFWTMIVDTRVSVIVMLTELNERGRQRCIRYWPDTGTHNPAEGWTVETTAVLKEGEFERRTLQVKTPAGVKHTVRHFHFRCWPDFGVCDVQSLLDLVESVRRVHLKSTPILVHCSAGVGRSGVFIAVDTVIREAARSKKIDVFGCVKKLREHRPWMVQTERQYELVYDAVDAWLTSNSVNDCGQSNCHNDDYSGMRLLFDEAVTSEDEMTSL